jgi:predicted dehydrogenase
MRYASTRGWQARAGGKAVCHQCPAGQEMVETAQRKGLFLMEAMWPRFLPAFDSIRQILSEGVLGEITSVVADLGEYFRPDPAHRLFSPDLAGGALLDLGVYLVSLSSFLAGKPGRVTAVGKFTP